MVEFFFSRSFGVGSGGISPAQAKAAKYGSLTALLPTMLFYQYKT